MNRHVGGATVTLRVLILYSCFWARSAPIGRVLSRCLGAEVPQQRGGLGTKRSRWRGGSGRPSHLSPAGWLRAPFRNETAILTNYECYWGDRQGRRCVGCSEVTMFRFKVDLLFLNCDCGVVCCFVLLFFCASVLLLLCAAAAVLLLLCAGVALC